MLFKEDRIAELEIENIKLKAMEDKLKEIKPLFEVLSVAILTQKDDIKRLEEKLDED